MGGNKVLLVATSHDKLGDTDQKTGAWLEEIAAPYYVFKGAGMDVTLASVKGGAIPLDDASMADPFYTADAKKFKEDSEAWSALCNSKPLADINPSDYAAVFVAGGHGIVYDGPASGDLSRVLSGIAAEGGVVSAVCHGPAGLVGAKGPDGKPLVSGKKVTGFSNSEEEAVQKTNVVPWLLADKLKELGGSYECGADWAVHVVTDGKLVTGQNPGSSEATAKAVLAALG